MKEWTQKKFKEDRLKSYIYQSGRDACYSGNPLSDNPYPCHDLSPEKLNTYRILWYNGWYDEYFELKYRFNQCLHERE